MGLVFEVAATDVHERPRRGESAVALARRLSLEKAESVNASRGALVIGCDTLVILDGEPLGKPPTPDAAVEMLTRLRDREHTVCSGLTVLDRARGMRSVQTALSPVRMRVYSEDELRRYVASGDPLERAGAYAIQHEGFSPVAVVRGCWANVVGLPLCHLYRAMRAWDLAEPNHPLDCCPRAVEEGCPWAREILENEPPEAS